MGILVPRIQQWYSIESERLNALNFMDELWTYWLPSDWASDLRLRVRMLSSRQGTPSSSGSLTSKRKTHFLSGTKLISLSLVYATTSRQT